MSQILNSLIEKQIEFQKLVGFPIDTILESERNELAEIYIFKLIEESIELRKEFPSMMNRFSKSNKTANMDRILEEFCDVLLFATNFMIAFKLEPSEVLSKIEEIQNINFDKVKTKLMTQLNLEIAKIPTGFTGTGTVKPHQVYISMNDDNTWEEFPDGQQYRTSVIKQQIKPGDDIKKLIELHKPFLVRELEILKANNPDMLIIAKDPDTQKVLQDLNIS